MEWQQSQLSTVLSQSRVLRNGQGRDKVVSVAKRGGAGGESGGRLWSMC